MLCGALQPVSMITGKVLDGTLPSLKGGNSTPSPRTHLLLVSGGAGLGPQRWGGCW